jgi:replicative DNA helicase
MSKLPEDVVTRIEEVANLREMEMEVRKAKTQREFDKLKTSQGTIDNIKNFDLEKVREHTPEKIKEVYQKIARNRKVLAEKMIFINEGLTAVIPFARGSLYLLGGVSGHGKSTTAANVSYPLWKLGKKVLVLANEEEEQNVYARIACLDLGLDFNSWRNNTMVKENRTRVDLLIPEVMRFVDVTGTDAVGMTTTIEGIKKILEQAKFSDYSCILIDYLQNISASVDNPSLERQNVLYLVKDYLNEFVKNANMPVVLFAQLYPLPPNSIDREFEKRIKWCKGIYEAATTVIEIARIKGKEKTIFVIDKDRFGMADFEVECKWVAGRYIFIPPVEDQIEDQIEKIIEQNRASKQDDKH